MNRLALVEARSQAADAVSLLEVTIRRVREERPADAAKLVERTRAEAVDALSSFGTLLALSRLHLGTLPFIAEDLILGLLGTAELDQAVQAIRQHPIL